MESQLMQIQAKPSDYKICRFCNKINWYENENCVQCGEYNKFWISENKVIDAIELEYAFWIKEQLTEEEIDTLKLEV